MSKYWAGRNLERLVNVEKQSEVVLNNINLYYNKAYQDIEGEIKSLFEKYAAKGGLSIEDAKEMLSKKETSAFYEYLLKEIKKVKDKSIRSRLLAKYNAPAYASRISRLQATQDQIYIAAKKAGVMENQITTEHYRQIIKDVYYRLGHDLQRQIGLGSTFSKLNDRVIDELLKQSFKGKNYSKRIWGNTEELAREINEVLGSGLQSGHSIHKMTKVISERMDVGKFKAARLVRTETNYYYNQATKLGYEEQEIEKYVYFATLDLRTSEICQSLDGKIYKVKEAEAGKNYPPMHPFCRSVTTAYFDNVDYSKQTSRARDPVTGKTYLVPRDMTYEKWYAEYVEGNKAAELKEKMLKNRSADKAQYAKYKELLGNNLPETLEKFQELKYNDEKTWKQWKGYAASIKSGELTPLAGFKHYKKISKDIDEQMIGKITANGIEITGKSNHYITRTIGSIEQKRNGVSIATALDALKNPIDIEPIKTGPNGKSQSFISNVVSVSVNPDTGTLIQVNPIKNRAKGGKK